MCSLRTMSRKKDWVMFPDGRKPIVSIRKSKIYPDSDGLFEECQFEVDDVLLFISETVY